MDFDESEDLQLLRKSVSDFMKKFPAEYWRRVDSDRSFPEEYWVAAAEQGLLGINIGEEYGGMGMGLYEASQAMMKVAEEGGGLPAGDLLMRTLVFGGVMIERFGRSDVKKKYLPLLAAGKLICSFAHTEPNAGVNTFDIQTVAEKADGGFRLNGQKIWI
ncbi:MAG: acyl-CoA dehydrogenase family protein, partial [Candidatus Caldarchaeum sp.]|nr:acyl-CoA dehydrogenase family protein [Candidatus Caldarchaeum sp.]